MLKMKEPPNNLLKTQGQIGTSQEVDEKERLNLISLWLYDSNGLKGYFLGSGTPDLPLFTVE